ncbi:MAG TPA: hypothetical protein DEF51_42310, partial [Myxococcales bacterium]|nr:hypothetical protein [Myxococcales bacterium]
MRSAAAIAWASGRSSLVSSRPTVSNPSCAASSCAAMAPATSSATASCSSRLWCSMAPCATPMSTKPTTGSGVVASTAASSPSFIRSGNAGFSASATGPSVDRLNNAHAPRIVRRGAQRHVSAGKKTLPYPEESVRPLQALRVVVVDGAQAGETVEIEDEGLHIGSAEGNDLRLSEDPTVSRFHVELTRREDGILVQDNGSTNGTFLGQARIERAVVPPGTELRVGRTAIRVEDGTRVSVEIALEEELGALKGTNPSMRKLFARVRKAAASDVPCLLVGESGTGKELFARAVHEHSKRADGPFVVVDCASLTPTLVASELFGHEKGAFTG